MTKKIHEPFFHLTKRATIGKPAAWGIRGAAFVFSVLFCAIVTVIITKKDMGFYFETFFHGVFGTPRNVWNFFHDTAILLLIALAVTPCFKMKFWNIGGEGQVLMGALGTAVIVVFMGGKSSDIATIIVSLIVAIGFGVVWCVIPAIFKAKWNTNETLLTLMMNYIAVCLVDYFIKSVATSGTGILTFDAGVIGPIAGNEFILKIIIAVIAVVFMALYLKFSKHGYEISVVGESVNTAKYVGIKTGNVIIRTMVLCGIMCGLIGFLIVSATDHSINSASTVSGRGFIGVLISWLAQFNPITMVIASFLFVFIDRGSISVSNYARLGDSYSDVMTGIFFFFIIAVEFFVNYKVVFRENVQIKLDGVDNKIRHALKMKPKPGTIEEKEDEEKYSDEKNKESVEETTQEEKVENSSVEEEIKEDK